MAGNDIAHGGGGGDTFVMGAALNTTDSIDGGSGNDVLSLNGDYSSGFTFGANTIISIENRAARRGSQLQSHDRRFERRDGGNPHHRRQRAGIIERADL